MKVLQISPGYTGGGAERCARELCAGLRTLGVQSEMWTAARSETDPPFVKAMRSRGEHAMRYLDLLFGHTDARHFGSITKLGKLTKRDFDLVHLHNLHGRYVSYWALQQLAQRIPVVWTLHDEWAANAGIPYDLTRILPVEQVRRIDRQTSRFLPCRVSFWTKRLQRFLCEHMPQPKIVITPSKYIRNLTYQSLRFPDTPIERIPYGLTLLEEPAINQDQSAARQQLNIPTDVPVVMIIAAQLQSPYKGMHLAVAALNTLAAAKAALPHVLLLGKGTAAVATQLDAKLNVHQHYAANNAELATAYRAADVTLIPSVADNFPYVGLESMACARPVIAFAVGGLTEMVSDQRGVLVPPFNTQLLAHTLDELLTQDDRRTQFGTAARKWVEQECDFKAYLWRISQLYQQVVAGSVRMKQAA